MTLWSRWVRHPQTLWLRRALFQIHLWTGLGVGLYILIISLSGSVLVYRSELRQTFDPQPRIVTPRGERLNTEQLADAAQRNFPADRVSVFSEPEDPTHAVTVSVHRDGTVTQRYFDPYTGDHLGHAMPWGWRATTWLLDLHDNLLSGDTGRLVNGGGALLMALLGVSGGVIWWPGRRRWVRSLKIDWRADWRRFAWSLHSVVGFVTIGFVLMWAVTGVYLSYPQPFMAAVDYLEPLDLETFEPRVGDAALYWLSSLHFGRFGGAATKLAWAVIGLAPPLLFVTGFVMWWTRVLRPHTRS